MRSGITGISTTPAMGSPSLANLLWPKRFRCWPPPDSKLATVESKGFDTPTPCLARAGAGTGAGAPALVRNAPRIRQRLRRQRTVGTAPTDGTGFGARVSTPRSSEREPGFLHRSFNRSRIVLTSNRHRCVLQAHIGLDVRHVCRNGSGHGLHAALTGHALDFIRCLHGVSFHLAPPCAKSSRIGQSGRSSP